MKLNKSQLIAATEPFVLKGHAADLHLRDVDIPSGMFDVELQVTPAGEDMDVKGRALLTLREICDRCLDPFENSLDLIIRLIVTERKSLLGRDHPSQVYFLSSGQQEIDLTPTLREALYLERSMKLVCRENCKGLCPHCGVNRNVKKCRCENDVVDERWAVLKQIDLSGID